MAARKRCVNFLARHTLNAGRTLGASFALVSAMYLALWPSGITFPRQWVATAMGGLGVVIIMVTETILFGLTIATKRAAGIVALGAVISLGMTAAVWGYVRASWSIVAMSVAALVVLLWIIRRRWGRHLNWEDVEQ
jgi:hypothetical protein